jgi:general secretion pathway protein D
MSSDDNGTNTLPIQGTAVSAPQTITIGGSENPVTISSDETNNAVLVYATARQYAVVEDALIKLDLLPLQVVIEASIVEVTLNDELRYGVQWFFETGGSQFALSEGKTSLPVPQFPGFSYVFTKNESINVTLNALQGVTTIKVVSAPKLLVLNNHTASMQVGDQVPIATQSSVSSDNPGAPIVNAIEYRDTGVILKVTPRVNDSGLVLLDIAQEVSDVSTTASSDIDSPTIQQRRIASSVAVKDGRTIALGGLIRDNSTRGQTGLPFLSQIPVIGALFGHHDDDDKRTELIVLLTPRVLRSPEDADTATQQLIEKMKATKPLIPR